jgi:hypothetical protein
VQGLLSLDAGMMPDGTGGYFCSTFKPGSWMHDGLRVRNTHRSGAKRWKPLASQARALRPRPSGRLREQIQPTAISMIAKSGALQGDAVVEKDSHLLELARYVVLNPVREGMVGTAGAWPWSSYVAMTGETPAPAWLQSDWVLSQFSKQRETAVNLYRDLVRAGVGLPSIWSQLKGQVFLGTEPFIEPMQRLTDKTSISEIPRAQRRPMAKPVAHYRGIHPDRSVAMAQTYATGDYTMQEIADCFGCITLRSAGQ